MNPRSEPGNKIVEGFPRDRRQTAHSRSTFAPRYGCAAGRTGLGGDPATNDHDVLDHLLPRLPGIILQRYMLSPRLISIIMKNCGVERGKNSRKSRKQGSHQWKQDVSPQA